MHEAADRAGPRAKSISLEHSLKDFCKPLHGDYGTGTGAGEKTFLGCLDTCARRDPAPLFALVKITI
jgi:hypothetical protein